ncbi:hypothetical protein Tco_1369525 [Tanacetum coccineum]
MGIEDRNIEKSEVKWSKMESANEHMNKLHGPAEEEKHLIKDNVVKDATRVDLPFYSNEPIWSQQEYFEDLGEYMVGQLLAFGYAISDDVEGADLWLINIAKKPLVVAGCVPQGSHLKELKVIKDYTLTIATGTGNAYMVVWVLARIARLSMLGVILEAIQLTALASTNLKGELRLDALAGNADASDIALIVDLYKFAHRSTIKAMSLAPAVPARASTIMKPLPSQFVLCL